MREGPLDSVTIGVGQLDRRYKFGSPIYCEVVDFLIEEAWILDDGRLKEWLALMATDVTYFMPTRATVQRGAGDGFDEQMGHFDENFESLSLRVRRIVDTESAWTERPPSRTRRIVSNIQVRETDVENEYAARSGCVLLRNRLDRPVFDILSTSREDVLRREGDGFLIASRKIFVDQATLGTANLSIFF
jgi:PAH dioxygenase small subunit